jgi:hypothetical protein
VTRSTCQSCGATVNGRVRRCPVCGADMGVLGPLRWQVRLGWALLGLALILNALIAWGVLQANAGGQLIAQGWGLTVALGVCGLPPLLAGFLFLYLARR